MVTMTGWSRQKEQKRSMKCVNNFLQAHEHTERRGEENLYQMRLGEGVCLSCVLQFLVTYRQTDTQLPINVS